MMMAEPTYAVKNWGRFQHFKDRRPPWVKLYRELLDDPEWSALSPAASKVLVMCWLLASESDCGNLPTVAVMAFRFRMKESVLSECLRGLTHFLIRTDITMISPRYQDDLLETETYPRETEAEADAQPAVMTPCKHHKRAIADTDKPTDKHRTLAGQWGLDVGYEWGKFKNYCQANDKHYANYEAAFRNWLANSFERKGGRRAM